MYVKPTGTSGTYYAPSNREEISAPGTHNKQIIPTYCEVINPHLFTIFY
jgi:hypothetical protein